MAQEIADSKLLDTWGSSGTKIEPDISKIIEGWQLGEQPPHEYMNWLQNTFGSKLNHILKNGVAEWNNETEYLAGASVQHSGSIWLCETTNTNSEPTGLNANWGKVAINKDLTATVDTIADLRSISYPVNTVWASGYHTKNDGAFGSHIFRLKGVKTTETDNGGTIIIATISGTDYVYELQNIGNIYVTVFGANKTGNSTSALAECHKYANANNRKVIYNLSSVKVAANAKIVINTSVDFNNCELQAIGGNVAVPTFSPINTMFIIKDENVTPISVTIPSAALSKGISEIVMPDSLTSGMLLIETNMPIGTRLGDTTPLFYKQTFEINRGILNHPLGVDLTAYTNTSTFYPDSIGTLVINGLKSDDSLYNNQCIIAVRRNNVIIEACSLVPKANIGASSINYIITFINCSGGILRDSKITAQYSTSTASYGISLESVANMKFENLTGTGRISWGVTGSNHVNGLIVINCDMNRIDVHSGMHNVEVHGGSLIDQGVMYGWGTGFIKARNIRMKSPNSIVELRGDYFGSFFGDIFVEDIEIFSIGQNSPDAIVKMNGIGGAGGIGTVDIAESVTIRNIRYVHDGAADTLTITPLQITKAGLADAVRFINKVEIYGISSKFRAGIHINVKLYDFINSSSGRCIMNIRDIDAFPNGTLPMISDSAADISSYPVDKVILHLTFSNVNGIVIWTAIPDARIDIENSVLCGIRNYSGGSSNQDVSIVASKIRETVSIGGTGTGIICEGSNINIASTIIYNNCNISTAKYLSGVAIAKGATVALPATVTPAQALSGWINSSIYQ